MPRYGDYFPFASTSDLSIHLTDACRRC